jgi:hypothetical protein
MSHSLKSPSATGERPAVLLTATERAHIVGRTAVARTLVRRSLRLRWYSFRLANASKMPVSECWETA